MAASAMGEMSKRRALGAWMTLIMVQTLRTAWEDRLSRRTTPSRNLQEVESHGATVVGLLVTIMETKLLFVTLVLPRAAISFGTLLVGFALRVLAALPLVGKGQQS